MEYMLNVYITFFFLFGVVFKNNYVGRKVGTRPPFRFRRSISKSKDRQTLERFVPSVFSSFGFKMKLFCPVCRLSAESAFPAHIMLNREKGFVCAEEVKDVATVFQKKN
jgi:hypothetical protein